MSQEHKSGAAARIGNALANIAAGAASGGAPGAVAGAVKSFLPELFKGVIIILCVLILLPFLLLCAVPNVLFGFQSAKAEDIIAFNDQASTVSSYYSTIDAATQSRIDEIVSGVVSTYTGEDGQASYDELEVSTQLGSISPNWFIAINSVKHQQDLFEMNEQSIWDVVREKLAWSWALIPRTIGEGVAAVVSHILRIDVRERTPEDLMDRLGFTEEQKVWAGAIRATLEEDQFVDTSGYGPGIDLGDFEFAEVKTPVVYYSQLDKRWCNTLYGRSDTIGAAGCGPTALAIAVASLADPSVDPVDVATWAADNGYCSEGHGSYHSLIRDGAIHYGLKVERIGTDARKLAQALKDGKLVIALMAKGHFTNGGHFITLRGLTDDGKVLVADPASTKRSNQEWDISIFPAEARRGADAGGPFWVISK